MTDSNLIEGNLIEEGESDQRIINEMATDMWYVTASYLEPKDICHLAECCKYLNDEVVWGKHSSALLWRETKVNLPNRSALSQACRGIPSPKHIEILIKANNSDEEGYKSALRWAIWHEHDIVKLLLTPKESPKVDPNTADQFGVSSLIISTFRGNVNMIQLLLEVGANVDHADQFGGTALIYAAMKVNVYVMRMLLAAGANVNITNAHGESALDIVRYKRYNPEIGRILSEVNRRICYQEALTLLETAVQTGTN